MGTANGGKGVALGPAVLVGNGVRFADGGVEIFTRVAKGESNVGVADGVGAMVGGVVGSFVVGLVAVLVGNDGSVDVGWVLKTVLVAEIAPEGVG